MYGLQRMTDSTKGAEELLLALTQQVTKAAERGGDVEPRQLSNALYGIQGFSCQGQSQAELLGALPALLRALAKWAQAQPGSEPRGFSAQGLGMALYGLQGIGRCSEVEELLGALLPYVLASPLDGQAVGNALYGLQSLSSDSEGPSLISLSWFFGSQSVSWWKTMVWYRPEESLARHLHTPRQVVRRLLGVFASKLKSFVGKMTEQDKGRFEGFITTGSSKA